MRRFSTGGARSTHAVRAELQGSGSSGRGTRKALRAQREDRKKVACVQFRRRSADGAEGTPQHGVVADERGCDRRPACAGEAAARRCLRGPERRHPASDALFAAPLSAAPRHLAAAQGRIVKTRSNSGPTISVTSTSTSPSFATKAARASCSSPSTAPRSSCSPASIARRPGSRLQPSSRCSSRPFPTRCTLCSQERRFILSTSAQVRRTVRPARQVRRLRRSRLRQGLRRAWHRTPAHPTIPGRTVRPNAWCEPSRTGRREPSIMARSTISAVTSGTGCRPITLPSNSGPYASEHPSRLSGNSARKSQTSSPESQTITAWN
ncbi:hypothetical protein Rvan_1097 [Rhodomicrobium vannielii ATCC 17100]|uniref:Uncharacterized protein n=1 Tax=Rhodomicrobium vannielii (strain ATCC 17100 / DSM 162 / LMG 4299 / NCIMB 10020 / ATH 3.1.1) TaxID=648757 RepID=E3I3M2_RHOVT|nr:hypothetical protein Rvan_1097 [Rhodomicrobium vannielii ATCC 17100]